MQTQFRRAVFTILSVLTVLAVAATSARAQTLPQFSLKQSGLTFAKSQGSQPMAASGGDQQHEGFGIGVLVGPLFDKTSEEDVDPENAFKGKTGLQFSLFLGGNRPGRVGIATEISLLRRKADNDVTINALQVPFFVRINIGSENLDRASVYIKVGPAIDVIFSAKQGDESFKDQVEQFQLDGIVGVGVEITRFIIEGRYIQGFRAINKEFNESSDIKTKAFALLFGFRFN
jgi:hypothetical protein